MQIKRVVGKLQRGFENNTRGRVFQQIGLPALLMRQHCIGSSKEFVF